MPRLGELAWGKGSTDKLTLTELRRRCYRPGGVCDRRLPCAQLAASSAPTGNDGRRGNAQQAQQRTGGASWSSAVGERNVSGRDGRSLLGEKVCSSTCA